MKNIEKITVKNHGKFWASNKPMDICICPECYSENVKCYKPIYSERESLNKLVTTRYKKTNYMCKDCKCKFSKEIEYKKDYKELAKFIVSVVLMIFGCFVSSCAGLCWISTPFESIIFYVGLFLMIIGFFVWS